MVLLTTKHLRLCLTLSHCWLEMRKKAKQKGGLHMTANQINRFRALTERSVASETERHNRVSEALTERDVASNAAYRAAAGQAALTQGAAALSQAQTAAERQAEDARHNLVAEQETRRHNVATEAAQSRQATAAERQAEAALRNSTANLFNADTNRRNADVNERNATVNERNATTNERNAHTSRKVAELERQRIQNEYDIAMLEWQEKHRHNLSVENTNEINAFANQLNAASGAKRVTAQNVRDWLAAGKSASEIIRIVRGMIK